MPWTSGEGAKLQMQKYGTPPNLDVLQLAVAIQGCLTRVVGPLVRRMAGSAFEFFRGWRSQFTSTSGVSPSPYRGSGKN